MKFLDILLLTLVAGGSVLASPLDQRANTDTTTVSLNSCSGNRGLFAAGLLYGVTGTNKPPQSYYSDLKINYQSSGGAQFDASPAGYATSMSSYNLRFKTVVDAFKRIRQNNGVLIVKMADLWGADETTNNSFLFPGDNGDWTKYDAFIQQVISDVKANGMANSYTTQLELWNEPDINFGGRPQSQFNAMFIRGVKALRAAFPSKGTFLPLVGPSTANNPGTKNDWWNSFLAALKAGGGTSVQPDVWNWHMEGGGNNDPIPPAQALPGYVQGYGLTTGIGLQNNEFGVLNQQKPSYSAWFMSRYERLKFNACRGNWASGARLNDDMAGLLLTNSDGSYSTTGDYVTHRFYANDMSGSPCTTTSGSTIDSFATAANGNVQALLGSQFFTGTANVVFDGVKQYFGSATHVTATTYRIPYNNGAAVTDKTLVKKQSVAVSSNKATVSIDVDNGNDAWAIVLSQ